MHALPHPSLAKGVGGRARVQFQALLGQLGEEHELQVSALLAKIASLESGLSKQAEAAIREAAPRGSPNLDFGDAMSSSTFTSEVGLPTFKGILSSEEAILSERRPFDASVQDDPYDFADSPICRKLSQIRSDTSSDVGASSYKMHAAWHNVPEFHGESGVYSIGRLLQTEATPSPLGERITSKRNLEKLLWSPDSAGCACLNVLVLSPTSGPSILWSMLSVLAVAYDLATIPLLLLGANDSATMLITSLATSMYWTVDLVVSFFKAYYDHGLLVTDIHLIASQYIRGWFVLDLLMVTLDWSTFLMQVGNGMGGLSRASRALRMLRLAQTLRLARVSKAFKLVGRVQEFVGGGLLQMQLSILGVSLGILTLSHWLACIWYGIGTIGPSETSWITVYGARPEEMSFGARYILCLHWALAQFGVGSSPLLPVSPIEYAYCSAVLMVALLMASSLVSCMTNAVAQLKDLKTDEIEQFTLLRRFCRDHGVPAQLYSRLYKYAEYRYNIGHDSLSINNVKLFGLMSRPLLQELHQHLWTPYLAEHPMLHRLSVGRHGGALRSLCYEATETRWLAANDLVHTHGTLASSMYFIVKGQLNYTEIYEGPEDLYRSRQNQQLDAPAYLLEMPLWVSWITMGIIEAASVTEILMLKGVEFVEVCERQPEAYYIARSYAVRYIMWLNNTRPGELSDTMRMPEDYRTLRSV